MKIIENERENIKGDTIKACLQINLFFIYIRLLGRKCFIQYCKEEKKILLIFSYSTQLRLRRPICYFVFPENIMQAILQEINTIPFWSL